MTPRAAMAAVRAAATHALAAIVSSTAIAPGAWGQALVRPAGEGALSVDYESYRMAAPGSPSWERSGFRSMLRLPLAGALLDEDVARYAVVLSPLYHRLQTGSDGAEQASDTRQMGYTGQLRLLSATAFPLVLDGVSESSSRRGDFGEHQDLDQTSGTASVAWQNPLLPITASITRSRLRDTRYAALQAEPLRRDERTHVTRLNASNSKTTALVERYAFDDALRGTRLLTQTGLLAHALRWGKASSLQSNASWTTVGGTRTLSQTTWGQRAHLQHTQAVYTDASWLRYAAGSADVFTTGNAADFALAGRLARGLELGLRARRSASQFSAGEVSLLSAGPVLTLSRALGKRITISANGGVYRDWHRRTLTDRGVYVLDEPHVVDSTRRIVLARQSVDATTLEVRSADRTEVYSPDLDYQVFPSEIVTELLIIPGGRIGIGDTLLVGYAFLLPERQPLDATSADYGAHVTSGPFSVFHRRVQRAVQPPTGTDLLPRSSDESSTGARMFLDRAAFSLDLLAEQRNRSANGLAFVTDEARATVAVASGAGTTGQASLSTARSRASDIVTRSTALAGGVSWWAFRLVRLSTELRAWDWRTTNAGHQRLLGGAVGSHLNLGLLEFSLRYDAFLRESAGAPTHERRLVTRFVRKY